MKQPPAPPTDEDIRYQLERERLEASRPKPKSFRAFNMVVMLLLFVAVIVAAILNRHRLGALWQQVTGKAPPLWVQPEAPEREGPEIEGRDF